MQNRGELHGAYFVGMGRHVATTAAVLAVCLASGLAWAEAKPEQVVLSIVGTSDLHGHIEALPWFSGYLKNLRAVRAPGAVILLDAGDMFQGTLESNLGEGASVIRAYNALGYTAATIGNHEFDFGPEGPDASPSKPGDDPRGALKARMAEARFPMVVANVLDRASGRPVAWSNVRPSVMIDAAGVRVGIVGAVTASTPRSSLAANVVGLDFVPPARAIAEEAQTLRRQGAQVVVAIVHEGGACTRFDEPERLDSCDTGSAVFAIARELPRGSVDVIVAGHTHQAVAQQVAGIPIIQSYANGRAFGRVDVTVDRATGAIATTHIQPPRDLCSGAGRENCRPGRYERRPVRMDSAIAKLNAPAFDAARTKSQERLAVEVLRPMPHNRGKETALGNLLVDLMRTARPSADVTLLNGGSMRAGLPAGPLTFGRLYETFPFDNMLAYANITASELARLLARSFQRSGSLVALSGLRVNVRCAGSGVTATLFRSSGKPVRDSEVLALLTNDFLATGGDGFFANAKLSFEMGEPLRDTLVESLRKRGGTLDPDDANLYDPNHPRIDLGGSSVPLRCPP